MFSLLLKRNKIFPVGFKHQWNLKAVVETVRKIMFSFHALTLETSVHLSLLLLIFSANHIKGSWEWHCSLCTLFSETLWHNFL